MYDKYHGFIQEKIRSEIGRFTKIGCFKTYPSQKSVILEWTFQKIRDLKKIPKIKMYNVMLHICSAANDFFTEKQKINKKKLFLNFFPQNYK